MAAKTGPVLVGSRVDWTVSKSAAERAARRAASTGTRLVSSRVVTLASCSAANWDSSKAAKKVAHWAASRGGC